MSASGRVKVYDNGGRSFDRYTAVYVGQPCGGGLFEARSLSHNPLGPQGFNQFTEVADGSHLGKRVPLNALPDDVQRAIYLDLTDEG